ncbi:MAG: glucuronate isomerase [Clostridia bacterium]|nr:glucuronate isomerase [Clostridia bacterium]
MSGFINEDFMLKGKWAKKLYSYVSDLPIIDYHCHLSPKMIAENHRFSDAAELFLGGDHYKWRQMRTNGIDEKYITGDATGYEKFLAFAKTMPMLIGNPIYHWTALELKRYFDIDEPLSEKNAEQIWNRCNELLARDDFRAQELIKRSGVEVICTTDDPADSLEYHKALSDFSVKVLPTFRPDRFVDIEKDSFIKVAESIGIDSYEGLCEWIVSRIEYFDECGCRLADHGFGQIPYGIGDAKAIFSKRMSGDTLAPEEVNAYKSAVISVCAREYARRGWTMQLHFGAMRNNNSKMFSSIGADTGFDSIGDYAVAEPLSRLLDSLDSENILPKTILYTLNPKDNYVLGTMIGNFQSGNIPGKIQFGSGWWFNDQRDGMEKQMRSLANLGMISRFVGMLTDSRSFVSYTRHEYFRRILSSLIGGWVDAGEYPEDEEALKKIVVGICYENAKNYFQF